VHPVDVIVARSAQLARAFRGRGLPVVLVNVAGLAPGRTERSNAAFARPPDWAELVPELDAQSSDLRVTKLHPGAFANTPLHRLLQERGVTQIVLTGVSTSSGVEATARAAYDYGYNVVLVVDAMTDLNAEMHTNSVERVFPKIGETTTTDAVLDMLGASL
jgi:nicotinamidase-related amidase